MRHVWRSSGVLWRFKVPHKVFESSKELEPSMSEVDLYINLYFSCMFEIQIEKSQSLFEVLYQDQINV